MNYGNNPVDMNEAKRQASIAQSEYIRKHKTCLKFAEAKMELHQLNLSNQDVVDHVQAEVREAEYRLQRLKDMLEAVE